MSCSPEVSAAALVEGRKEDVDCSAVVVVAAAAAAAVAAVAVVVAESAVVAVSVVLICTLDPPSQTLPRCCCFEDSSLDLDKQIALEFEVPQHYQIEIAHHSPAVLIHKMMWRCDKKVLSPRRENQ